MWGLEGRCPGEAGLAQKLNAHEAAWGTGESRHPRGAAPAEEAPQRKDGGRGLPLNSHENVTEGTTLDKCKTVGSEQKTPTVTGKEEDCAGTKEM